MKEQGLRFNEGKLRYDLIHPEAEKGLVEILTFGATKYAERNWEKGMAWSKVISSLKRHIAAIERGEDRDVESGKLHADHVQCNAHFLSAYYRIFPQGDDRPHRYLNVPRIGLDLDDVCVDWVKQWCKLHSFPVAKSWWFQYDITKTFEDMKKDGKLDEFYLNLPSLVDGTNLPFDPICYISHRPVSEEITKKWLEKHQFPLKTVYITKSRDEKLEVCKNNNLDYFIDDNYDTFILLNKNGICCFLMDATHNQQFEVGYKRIKNFDDFKERFL